MMGKPRYKYVDSIVCKLFSAMPEFFKAPIDIDAIVRAKGILLIEKDFGSSMSGAALIEGDKRVISVNSNESRNRRRFTIGHELGHLFLHNDQPLNISYPNQPKAFLRDSSSSTGLNWREIEANYFAASVLMPRKLVAEELDIFWDSMNAAWDEDLIIDMLAEKFDVSQKAMAIRLGSLGLAVF